MSRNFCVSLVSGVAMTLIVLTHAPAQALDPVATYLFNGNFNAVQPGAPLLTPADPLGTSAFISDTVFGETRTVYAFNGHASPVNEQAGLTLNTTGLIAPDNYSIEMVSSFSDRNGAWRRLIDVQNRQSDEGFYVDPSNTLDVYPVSGSPNTFTNNVYHDIILTDANTGVVKAYLDGQLQFTINTTQMHLNNLNNPNLLMNFFLDNTVGGGQGEFSNGKIGLIRAYNGVLTDSEINIIGSHPFAPAPSSVFTLLLGGVPGIIALSLRHKRKKATL